MQRLVVVPMLVLLLALTACGSAMDDSGGSSATAPAASTAPVTNLKVTVWADPSTSAAPTVTTVTTAPAGITAASFAPTPSGQACTMIYGGPGKATITGTLAGTAVDGTFTRSDGCEIARWDAMVDAGVIPKGVGGM
jgi:hypothetical protein